MSFFDQIKKEREPKKLVGYQWLTMLLKYEVDEYGKLLGNGEVIRSFSRAAKDSDIKSAQKTKETKHKRRDIQVTNVEEEDLFD